MSGSAPNGPNQSKNKKCNGNWNPTRNATFLDPISLLKIWIITSEVTHALDSRTSRKILIIAI